MQKLFVVSCFIFIIISCNTSKKITTSKSSETSKKSKIATTTEPKPDSVVVLQSGLQYQVLKHGNQGSRKPIFNDKVEMELRVAVTDSAHKNDSVIYDSQKMNKGKPLSLQITKPKFKGDPMEVYLLFSIGDSVIIKLPVDSIKNNGNQLPPWMQEGKIMEYNVKVISIKNDSEARMDKELKIAQQKIIDDSLLRNYFLTNKINPVKTSSGLYYYIQDSGYGELPKTGKILSIYYEGKLLNGNVFDTNEDSTFHHQEPIKVELGQNRVIRGWEEGLTHFKKGAKGFLYIPSNLGYGPKDHGNIPGNSVLVFQISLINIQNQDEIDSTILQKYFLENNINPLKTLSGVYYTISKKGKGAKVKSGQKVTVRYTGKTLDGNTFDTNTDTSAHKPPFSFEVGKGSVIKGWDEVMPQLNKGNKATLYIPSRLGYGSKGQGRKIPSNSILIFDVEIIDVK